MNAIEDRGVKFLPGLLPETIVLDEAPSFRSNIPWQKPIGRQVSSVTGKKHSHRAAALSYFPPQNLLLTSSGSTLLHLLVSPTPFHRFPVLSVYHTVNSQLPVGGLSRWLINLGCWDAEPAQI